MNASIEWLDARQTVGLIRTHADGGVFGDPYTWSVVFTRFPAAPGAAVLKGIYRNPTREEGHAAREALRSHGFYCYYYTRIRGGKGRGRLVPL